MSSTSMVPLPTSEPQSLRKLIERDEVLESLLKYVRLLLTRWRNSRGWASVVDDAEEIFQEVMVRALAKESTYRPEQGGLAWLRQVAHRLVLNRLRRVRQRSKLRCGDGLFEAIAELIPAPVVDDPTWIWEHVDRLESRHRDVLRLRFDCGLDNPAVARRLDLSGPKAAADLVWQARKELRAAIQASLA